MCDLRRVTEGVASYPDGSVLRAETAIVIGDQRCVGKVNGL